MSPELQILVDRVEVLERQARNWSRSAGLAILLAAVAIVMSFLGWSAAGRTPASEYGRFSVVEADRFLLRDLNGKVAGGLEAGRDSVVKLVLGGRGGRAAAFLEVRDNGIASLTLRAPGGALRAALVAGETPVFSLVGRSDIPGVSLRIAPDGAGSIQAADAFGRPRFRAP